LLFCCGLFTADVQSTTVATTSNAPTTEAGIIVSSYLSFVRCGCKSAVVSDSYAQLCTNQHDGKSYRRRSAVSGLNL